MLTWYISGGCVNVDIIFLFDAYGLLSSYLVVDITIHHSLFVSLFVIRFYAYVVRVLEEKNDERKKIFQHLQVETVTVSHSLEQK